MKRKLILHATNEHPAIYREGHRLVAGKDTNKVSKEKGPATNKCVFIPGSPDTPNICYQCGKPKEEHDQTQFCSEEEAIARRRDHRMPHCRGLAHNRYPRPPVANATFEDEPGARGFCKHCGETFHNHFPK